ncbi:hypothetical protein HYT05_03965 [Candidatus Kaiserbacteria bacterium]|nr:hypothetical protein [Candidatus Kaiserbacteria bacterium]
MLRESLILVAVAGKVDVGFDDPDVQDVTLDITPAYDSWLKKRGKAGDVEIMQSQPGALSTSGPAAHAIDDYLNGAIHLVESLIQKGVPEEVAHQLLPHELYLQLHKG